MANSVQIEEAAAAWLAKRDSGDWEDADQAAFSRWLEASTANRVAFLRLEAAWQQTHRLKALGAGAMAGVVPAPGDWRQSPFFDKRPGASIPALGQTTDDIGSESGTPLEVACDGGPTDPEDSREAAAVDARRPTGRLRKWAISFQAIAAGLALATLVGGGWFLWPHGSSYRTDVGGLESVPLSDGSKVTLNTDSAVRVAVTETERGVTIDQGEAYFEVAKDPNRPFVVRVGNERVIAVGTKFSVRRDADAVRVVVTEGRVRLERIGSSSLATVAQLAAGTVARVGVAGTLVQEKPVAEAEEYLSWRTGFLVFRDTTLGEAVAEFNRYNTTKIAIDDPAVASIHVGGSFRSNNVDAFVRLIEQGLPVYAERSADRIVLKAT